MYMYITFQQSRVIRSVISVHTNLFAKIFQLHKLETSNNNILEIDSFRQASSFILIFSKIGLVDPVKTVHTNLFAKIFNLNKFAIFN